MNAPRGDSFESHLEDYLDGRLDDAARWAFEQRLAEDAELREQVALQRDIDAGMKRLFTAGSAEAALQRLQPHAGATNHRVSTPAGAPVTRAPEPQPRAGWRRVASMELGPWQATAALAATLLLAVGLSWFWWSGSFPFGSERPRPTASGYGSGSSYGYGDPGPRQSPLGYYQNQVASGFEAQWPCPPDRFERVIRSRFAVGLTYEAPTAERVRLLGASYANIFSPQTVAMLGRVDSQPVIVFVDRSEAVSAGDAALAREEGLHLHRRRLGSLTLYELSPLEQPRLLPLFSMAAAGPGGAGGGDVPERISAAPGFGACSLY